MIKIKYIAHRGCHDKYKENSIDAFKEATRNPLFDGFEFDVRETKDHYYVINHDPVSNGKIIKLSLFKELNLPSLEDVLKLNTNKIKLLEIKDYFINYDSFIKLVKDIDNLYIMSFYNHHIKYLNRMINNKVGSLNYYLNDMDYYHYDFICLLSSTKKEVLNYQFNHKEIFYYGFKKHHLNDDAYLIIDKII